MKTLLLALILATTSCQAIQRAAENTGKVVMDKLPTIAGAGIGFAVGGPVGGMAGAALGDTVSDAVAAEGEVDVLEEELDDEQADHEAARAEWAEANADLLAAIKEAERAKTGLDLAIQTMDTLKWWAPWVGGGFILVLVIAWLKRSPLEKRPKRSGEP